jgi:hypothetical protein
VVRMQRRRRGRGRAVRGVPASGRHGGRPQNSEAGVRQRATSLSVRICLLLIVMCILGELGEREC